MPAVNFRTRFAVPILERKKFSTVRKVGSSTILRGNSLYLYTGLRTKNAIFLGKVQAVVTYPIRVMPEGVYREKGGKWELMCESGFVASEGLDNYLEFYAIMESVYKTPKEFDFYRIVWNPYQLQRQPAAMAFFNVMEV